MKTYAIESASLLAQPIVIERTAISRTRPAKTTVERIVARSFQAAFSMGALGALANEAVGPAQALLLVLLVLPFLASLATRAVLSGSWDSTGGIAHQDTARTAALLAPVLAIPGALAGWVGAALMIVFGGLALSSLLSRTR